MKKLLEYGMYAFVFLLPWQTVWIIHEATIGAEGAMGVWQYGTLKVYAIEFLVVALGIVAVASQKIQRPKKIDAFTKTVILFFLLAGFSVVWSKDHLVALLGFVRLCEGAFLFFLFRSTSFRWSWFLSAWIFAAVIQGALGIWQFVVQEVNANTFFGIAAHVPSTLGDAVVQAGDRRWLRAYGAFQHPNIFGTFLAISFTWCVFALSVAKKKWQWVSILVSSQLILIALLLAFSRSAWIGLTAAGVCAFLWACKKQGGAMKRWITPVVHPVVVLIVASALTVGAFSAYFTEEIQTRIGLHQSRLEVQSFSERGDVLKRALPFFEQHWLGGAGVGNFTNTLFQFERDRGAPQPWHTYQPIHNVFLMVLVELGVGGFFLLLAILALYLRRIGVEGHSLLVILFVASLFDHFLWTLPFGLFLACIVMGVLQKKIISTIP